MKNNWSLCCDVRRISYTCIDQFDFKNVASAIPGGLPRAWQKMMQWPRRTPVPELKQCIVWNTHLLSCSWMPPMYGGRSDIMFLKPNWSIGYFRSYNLPKTYLFRLIWGICGCKENLTSSLWSSVVKLSFVWLTDLHVHVYPVIRHLLRWQLLRWWYLGQQRVRVRVMIGFLVWGRVRIKIRVRFRVRVRVRVGVTFNINIYHRSNCRQSKCRTFVCTQDSKGNSKLMRIYRPMLKFSGIIKYVCHNYVKFLNISFQAWILDGKILCPVCESYEIHTFVFCIFVLMGI